MSRTTRKSTRYMKAIVDFSDGMRIISCDSGFARIFGYSQDEVAGGRVSVSDIMSPDEIGEVRSDVLEQLENDTCAFFRTIYHNRFGDEVDAETYLELAVNPENDHVEGKALVINQQGNASRTYTDTIIRQVPAGIAIIAVDNNSITIKNANEEFYKILGFKDEQDFMINNGESLQPLIAGEDYERLMVRFTMCSQEDDTVEYKGLVHTERHTEGVWISLRLRFLEEHGETKLFQAHIEDITRRKEMEIELNTLNARRPLGITEELVFRLDVVNDVMSIPVRNLLGQTQESVIDNFISKKKWAVFVHEKDIGRIEEAIEKAYNLPATGEIVFRNKLHAADKPEWFKMYYKNNATEDTKAEWIMGRIVNITEEMDSGYKVDNRIKRDSITGFYNYENFRNMAGELLHDENTRRSAVIVVCIKNLNSINKNFGSMFADTVVQNVSRKLLQLVRETDICGRLNQETFAIWLKNVEPDIVSAKAKEMCNAISTVYTGERKSLNILSCAGVSEGDGSKPFEDTFVEAYSAMMYARARENKCTVSYRENMPRINVQEESFKKELYYRIENYDVDMLSFAFGLLVNSRDIRSSINLLIQRIGERYNLDDVIITTLWADESRHLISHYWSKKDGIKKPEPLADSADRVLRVSPERFDKNGMFVYNAKADDEWTKAMEEGGYHIRSMIGSAYYIDNSLAGFIAFIDENNQRDWPDYVRGTFFEMVNILAVFLSINDNRNKDKKRIEQLSDYDRLTGLYNLDTFKKKAEELGEELDETEHLVLIFTDINNFSYVNDAYGQQTGDSVLRDFGAYLGKRGNISCRVYSDFFLTIGIQKPGNLEHSVIANANRKFERLTRRKLPLSNIRLSTGLVVFRPEDCDIETAIDNANMARKVCKQSGDLRCVVYDADMRKDRENEQRFVGGLQEAIKNGEFKLYLQPKFRLDTKEVIGAEALSRWLTSDGILHFPDEFIPMFEKQGQIVQVDFFIYEQVMSYMKKWKDSGRTLIPVSVNFSRINIAHESFVDELDKLAAFYGIPTKMIEIEITESAISMSNDEMIRVLDELRAHGFIVDMDDFGTGLSSLNMLINAPVDVVKVDKSFLYNSFENKNRKYIEYVGGLISAADKEVVFEGVENEEQAEFLINCGYTKAQGYLFDTPLDVAEFEKKYIYS